MALFDVTLRERMHEWLEEGHRAFVLNLANVPYVDSFGLGQLITILALIRSKGGPTRPSRAYGSRLGTICDHKAKYRF